MQQLTDAQIIAHCRNLHGIIERATIELKLGEKELIRRALNRPHDPLTDGNREGRRAILKDGDQAVTVRFESDILKASWAFDSQLTTTLQSHSGHLFDTLFRTKTTVERRITDGHKFRLLCHKELPEPQALAVIEALKDKDKNGITKSKTVVEWDAKEGRGA